MNQKQMGILLTNLRQERGMTQAQLAQQLHVSPQAVSKWECGNGCPDLDLLSAITEIFGISMAQFLRGDLMPNAREVGNMKRVKFYVCPKCGDLLTATGNGEVHCCGRKMDALTAKPVDEAHQASIETVENEWYITFSHPMEKEHFIQFAALVNLDHLLLVRLYPEQGGELRVPRMAGAKLYLYCSQHGFFKVL